MLGRRYVTSIVTCSFMTSIVNQKQAQYQDHCWHIVRCRHQAICPALIAGRIAFVRSEPNNCNANSKRGDILHICFPRPCNRAMDNGALNLHEGVNDHCNSYQSAQLVVRLSHHSQRPMPG